jgi:1-deoxy-D-xylulose-5-phosphate synthase
VLLHVVTKKGKGYAPAEDEPTKFHGVGRFNIITGETEASGKNPSYTSIFSKTICRLAEQDERVVAITAAMADGTGLDEFSRSFPDRFFDVGIAEGHALTFAAGLAANGMKPVCAIYSTFLQRGLDQMIHDIALQNLPVVVAIDRAGIVGEDGATHQGAFDLSFTRFIPNFTIMAPADENELQHMLKTALTLSGPSAIRYPRGAGRGVSMDAELKTLPVGKAEIRKEGTDVAILALGSAVGEAEAAAQLLAKQGISTAVVNMRYLKPLDCDTVLALLKKVRHFVVVEENAVFGGLNSAVDELLIGSNAAVLNIGLPDMFIEHGNSKILRDKYGLSGAKIAERVAQWFGERKENGSGAGKSEIPGTFTALQ